jgi:glycerol-3-phosphate dehydrogenase (NAD(P)+)
MTPSIKTIAIIGDGAWGTTLAVYLGHKGHCVKLWGAFPEYTRRVRVNRYNYKYLPGIKIPDNVEPVEKLKTALEGAQLVILAFPSKFAIKVLRKLKKCDLQNKMFLSVIKGIDHHTHLRISQMIERELGRVPLAVLSGPTIAMEVAKGIPSTAVVASKNKVLARNIQSILNSEKFRIYTNDDVAGVELGGSVKNIIAIACGVCDGLGLGSNTKAAILTRGLAEMARLGKTFGAREKTFAGLSGLGDLVTTCISPQSRNRYVGEQLGKGRRITEIVSSMNAVAEGIVTSKAVLYLSKKYRVEMPITAEVYNIIYRAKKPAKAMEDLMNRKMKPE